MWIPITLAAATFQILRTSRQHVLRSGPVASTGRVRALRVRVPARADRRRVVTFGARSATTLPVTAAPVLADHRRRRHRPDPRHGRAAAGVRPARLRDRHGVRQDRGDPRRHRVGRRARASRCCRCGWVAVVVCMAGVVLARRAEPRARRVLERRRPCGVHGRASPPAGFAMAAVGIRAASNIARRRPGVEPGAAHPDRDARHPDADQRHADSLVTDRAELVKRRPVTGGRRSRSACSACAGRPDGRWRSRSPTPPRSARSVRSRSSSRSPSRRSGSTSVTVAAEYAASALVLVGVVGVIAVG